MKTILENVLRKHISQILQDDNFNHKSPNLDERIDIETNDFNYLKSLLIDESEHYKNYEGEEEYYEKVLSQILLMSAAACIPFATMLFNKFQNQYKDMTLKVETEDTIYINLQSVFRNVICSRVNEAIKGVYENPNEPALPFEDKENGEEIEGIEIGTKPEEPILGTVKKGTFPRV